MNASPPAEAREPLEPPAPARSGQAAFLLAACCFVATANSATIGYDSSMMVCTYVSSHAAMPKHLD